MVNGLDTFKNYFEGFANNYIIIGGAACDIIITKAGFKPRTTRDIDIILVVEALSLEFVTQFWNFVRDGGYEIKEQNQEERKYYRFSKPTDPDFPLMIELFSREQDLLKIEDGGHLTPIPIDEDVSSLSAILMDDNYYHYTLNHCTLADGIHNANTEALVCLKARAYLDMIARRDQGETNEEGKIKKHKADIFRLATTLAATDIFTLPEPIHKDLSTFIEKIENELPDRNMFKEMGLGKIDPKNVFSQLKLSFQLN